MEMKELKEKLLEEFKVGVQQVIKGEIEQYNSLLSMGGIENYMNSIGAEADEMSTNGWQWDWWNPYIIEGKTYNLSGSGYYGGLSFNKDE